MRQNIAAILWAASLLLIFSACSKDDDDNGSNLVDNGLPPTIDFAEGRNSFRPDNGESRSTGTDHIHVRFSVADPSGLGEVRVGVSGIFEGNVPDGFELLDVADVYSPDASEDFFRFSENATTLNVDATETDIYWEGSTSRIEGNVIAGPYDFTISATDAFGNATPSGEEVRNRFYINRNYAPQVQVTNLVDDELKGEAGQPLVVEGSIRRGIVGLSSDIAFIWVRLVEEDEHNDFEAGSSLFEATWGQSLRFSKSGVALPSTTDINLAGALAGENEITIPEGHGHYHLIVWAEDVNGNVTRASVDVHVD